MKTDKKSSFVETNKSKFQKLSLIKDKNINGKLNASFKSNYTEKANNISLNMSFSKVGTFRNNRNTGFNNNKTLFSNNMGFVSHFGKGNTKRTNDKQNNNINIFNLNSNKNNNFINNTFEMNNSENSDNEENLKYVENELKNKIKDMTIIMQDNKSFNMDFKWKGIDIISIEEEEYRRTKKFKKIKKKRKKNKIKEKKIRKILKKSALYDSLDEEENQGDDNLGCFFIDPEGVFILILDTFVFVASFICFLYTPLQIAKSKCFCIEEYVFIKIIFLLIDLIFIFDLFISFFRGYYNYEYQLIKETKLIVKHYIKSNFFFDFLEALPFNIMIFYFCINNEKFKPDGPLCLYNGINGIYSAIKLFSGLKIFKILKVMNKKKNKAYYYLKEIDDHIIEQIIRLFSFVLLFLGSMNAFICIHIFIGIQSYPNWLIAMGIQDLNFIQIYIAALYGIIETLTTVGYGDVVINSFTEICFQIVLLSVGIVAYSWLITIIGNYVKNESKADLKHSKDLTTLEEIRIEYPTMSFKLYNKIHQHLKSVSNQQKKIDLNILVNSLPYSIKNMLLFRIYNIYIERLNIFKRCDNTDFISRLLTNFIPLFSRQKALLIREGENIENLFFVKTGKLSLDAALDLKEPQESIKRYLYEKFDDVIEKDKKNETHINKEIKETVNPHDIQIEKVNTGIQNIFNQKKNSLSVNSYHESRIEQEIGKCDLGGSEDFEERNYKFLCIMAIKKNENFGITYMQLNKPCPLSLRVKSKKADIFILRKYDVINISKAYPSIWKKISENALYNMIGIKNKTFDILKNYCSYHGIVIDDKKPKKTDKINPLNILEIKEMMELEKIKKEEQELFEKKTKKLKEKTKKKISITKKRSKSQIINEHKIIANIRNKIINKNHDNSKTFSPFITKLEYNKASGKLGYNSIFKQKSFKDNLYNFKLQLSNQKSIKEEDNNINELQKSKINNKSNKKEKKNRLELPNNKIINEEKNNIVTSFTIISEEKNNKNHKENKNIKEEEEEKIIKSNIIDDTDKLYINENDKLYPNTLSNLSPIFSSILKKKILKKNYKNKHYYKQMCLKLTEALNNLIKNITAKNEYEYNSPVNKNNPLTFKNNNYLISYSNLIFPITEKLKNNNDLMSSTSQTKSEASIIDKLSIEKNDSIEYKSIYNNLNIISNGNYEKNKEMQKKTEDFIKSYYQNIITKTKSKNYSKTPKTKKKEKKDISFSLSLRNISEIKSNDSYKDSINSKTKQIQTGKNSPKKILKKDYDSKKNKKNKKIKFSIPINNKISANNIIDNSPINKDTFTKIINSNHINLNVSETSENNIINNKNLISGNEKKIFNYKEKKAKTFINKMFNKKKKEKESINKSQSKEFLYEFNNFNPEIGLRNNINFEELKNKTLNKLNTYSYRGNSKSQKIGSNKNVSLDNGDKINNNCIMF